MDLGRVDKTEGKKKLDALITALVRASDTINFLDVTNDLKAYDAKDYGPQLIFNRLWQTLGLKEIIGTETKKEKTQFAIDEAIFNMVLNRLCAPSSKRHLETWQEDIFNITAYDVHQYYRAMDYLIENKNAIEKRLFYRMRDLFNMSVDVVLFDTTTIVYYGDGDSDEDELLAHGFSKDKRGDLKQVVVGVIMSKEGVPLGHEVFAGNKNDVTCFKEIVDKISNKFEVDKVVLVGDRGMVNQKNINLLDKHGYKYILGYRMRTITKEDRALVLAKANLKIIKKDTLHWKEVKYKEQRLLVCYNPERAEIDRKKRDDIIERIKERIKGGDIKSLVSNKDYKRFLLIEGKRPKLDEAKIAGDAIYDGIYVITSNTQLDSGEIISGYRDLWQVEMAFRQLKSEIQMGPMYHWREKRIRSHIMICFFALVLRSELYRCLQQKYKTVSYPKVLSDIKALKMINIDIKGEKILIRTELKPGAMQSIKALKMRAPARIFHSSATKPNLI